MTASTVASGRPRSLAFLPEFLFAAEGSRLRYAVKAWLLALLPSLALAGLIDLAAPASGTPDFPVGGATFLALVLVVAPLAETLLMVPPLWALARLAGPGAAAIGSALLWAGLHSLAVPLWGLVVWWPFLILSVVLLTWRRRGLGTALLMVAGIHAMQNATSLALALLLHAGS